jgi:2-oxoisovalerate dehydrogenase E1 component alpha subunit
VILNVVNNQWAISTFQAIAGGESTTFAARGVGSGIASLRVDGNDFLAVLAASRWAAERARSNLGPTLIEWLTYRAGAHSTSRRPLALPPGRRLAALSAGRPDRPAEAAPAAHGRLVGRRTRGVQKELDAEVAAAQRKPKLGRHAARRPHAAAGTMFEGVYKDMPAHLHEQMRQAREGV